MPKAPVISIRNLNVSFLFSENSPIQQSTIQAGFSHQAHEVPEVGASWPGKGGINGGFVPAHGDMPAHYLIFADRDVGEHEWGGRNTESKAVSRHNGKANTDALIAEGGHPAAEAARAHQADGHADFDLPAASQLYQALVHGLITEGAYWSSSQRSAYCAFDLIFVDGYQDHYDKKRATSFASAPSADVSFNPSFIRTQGRIGAFFVACTSRSST